MVMRRRRRWCEKGKSCNTYNNQQKSTYRRQQQRKTTMTGRSEGTRDVVRMIRGNMKYMQQSTKVNLPTARAGKNTIVKMRGARLERVSTYMRRKIKIIINDNHLKHTYSVVWVGTGRCGGCR